MKRWLARLALCVLVLAAEVTGRSLTHRINLGLNVEVSYRDAAYYPFVLAAVKIGIALMLARVLWRFFQARRVASVLGGSPRLRLELSWRLWLASFVGTAGVYLVQTGAEHAALHSSALPVFAVLAVFVAVIYRAAERWLGDYERIAAIAVDLCRRIASHRPPLARPHTADALPPRRLFGLAFESRPPPLPAR
jgi:drug/metabolite transporter (DMT)-like permease